MNADLHGKNNIQTNLSEKVVASFLENVENQERIITYVQYYFVHAGRIIPIIRITI